MNKFKSIFVLFILFNSGLTTNRSVQINNQKNNLVNKELSYSIKKISTGTYFSSIVLDYGNKDILYSWGLNNVGQLGIEDLEYINRPTKVELPIEGVIKFSNNSKTGGAHSSVVVNDGYVDHLYTWGKNSSGQLGIGDEFNRYTPQEVELPIEGVIKFSDIGSNHSLIVMDDGTNDHLYMWGDNEFGQLGFSDNYVAKPKEVILPNEGKIKNACLGSDYSSIIITDSNEKDHLYTWGKNDKGQLGLGDKENRNKPTKVTLPIDGKINKISLGSSHSSVVVNDGTKDHLYLWGLNNRGQLGLGDIENKITPTEVTLPIDGEISEISLGSSHSSVVINDGTKDYLYIWGDNTLGKLGLGDLSDRDKPTKLKLPIDGKIKQISLGWSVSSIVLNYKEEDHLYIWGSNDFGQLGLGDEYDSIDKIKNPIEVKYYLKNPNPYVNESFEVWEVTHNSFNFSFNIYITEEYINISEDEIKTNTYLELNGQKFDAKFLDSSSESLDSIKYNFNLEGLKPSNTYNDVKLHIGGTDNKFDKIINKKITTKTNKSFLFIEIVSSILFILIIIFLITIIILIKKRKKS